MRCSGELWIRWGGIVGWLNGGMGHSRYLISVSAIEKQVELVFEDETLSVLEKEGMDVGVLLVKKLKAGLVRQSRPVLRST